MTMHVEVRINRDIVGEVEIVNTTHHTGPDDTNTYQWLYTGEHGRTLHDELTHRYGDGAIVLASKVLSAIALRYQIAGSYTPD